MILFLSAEPKMPGDQPPRVQLGQAGGEPPERRFDSLLSEAADSEDIPVEGSQGDDLLAGDEPPAPDLDITAADDALIKRGLPDTAAPVAVLARSALDTAIPGEGMPNRRSVGLDETTLPQRTAQVWLALSDGDQPIPPSQPAAVGKSMPAALNVARAEPLASGTPFLSGEIVNQTRRKDAEHPALPQRNLPEQAVARVPHAEDGRVPGLIVTEEARQRPQDAQKAPPMVLPPQQEAGREPHKRPGAEPPIDRLPAATQGNPAPLALAHTAAAAAQERLAAKTEIAEKTLKPADPMLALGASASERPGVHQASVQSIHTQSSPPELARHSASQMAVAITQNGGKSTEIALNPEELGRVRMSLSAVENSVNLTVYADRPETVDLLRRHMDILAQEFRALGYADIQFSFSGGETSDGQTGETGEENGEFTEVAATVNDAEPVPVTPDQGVDLRL